MEHKNFKAELWEKLEANYISFLREWIKLEPLLLVEKAEEITATKLVYNKLKDDRKSTNYLEYLLHFNNPLEVVRDKWIEDNGSDMVHDGDINHVLWSIADKYEAEQAYELNEDHISPKQGVRMC